MATLPPPPINDNQAGFGWIDWQRQVRDSITGTEGQVKWDDIDFTGSDINDIQAKNHNILQGLQGGKSQEYYHLTQAQYNALGTGDHNSLNNLQGGITTERYHLTEPQYNWVVAGGSPYTLPIASDTVLGGIKVGVGLSINNITGVLDVTGGSGGGLTAVTGTAPIHSSGGAAPDISITAATTSAAGSMSAADKTKLDSLGPIPSGMVSDFAFATPPSGWLLCNGAAVSRTTYSALFAAVGTTWGAGDGSTTFNLPSIAYYTQDLYKTGSGGTGTATTITCIKT